MVNYVLQIRVHHQGQPGTKLKQEPETGTKEETMKGLHLGLTFMASQIAFLYSVPRAGTIPSLSNSNEENTPQANQIRYLFEVPFSQVVDIKLTKTDLHTSPILRLFQQNE